jgi:hypothetical protein
VGDKRDKGEEVRRGEERKKLKVRKGKEEAVGDVKQEWNSLAVAEPSEVVFL